MRADVLGEITLLNTLVVTSLERAMKWFNLRMKTKVSNEMILPGERTSTSSHPTHKGPLARVRAEVSRETTLLYTSKVTSFDRTRISFDFRMTFEMPRKSDLLGKCFSTPCNTTHKRFLACVGANMSFECRRLHALVGTILECAMISFDPSVTTEMSYQILFHLKGASTAWDGAYKWSLHLLTVTFISLVLTLLLSHLLLLILPRLLLLRVFLPPSSLFPSGRGGGRRRW